MHTNAADIIVCGLDFLKASIVVCCKTEGQTLLESIRLKHLEKKPVNDLFRFLGEHAIGLEAEVQRSTSADLFFEIRVKLFEVSLKFIFLLLRRETSPTTVMVPRFDEALLIKIHAVEFLVDNVEESWNLLNPIIQKRENYKNYLLGCTS